MADIRNQVQTDESLFLCFLRVNELDELSVDLILAICIPVIFVQVGAGNQKRYNIKTSIRNGATLKVQRTGNINEDISGEHDWIFPESVEGEEVKTK